jgi:hypothetical protein
MIYFSGRSLFIHIPRTSGMSISKAVLDLNHPDLNVVLGAHFGPFSRHAQANVLKDAISDFDKIHKFCIIRNPWRIVESTYRLAIKLATELKQMKHRWMLEEAKQIWLKTLNISFEEFVIENFDYLQKGFYAHWCLEWGTFKNLGIEAYKFENLNHEWPHICQLLQLPEDTVLPHENEATDITSENIVWTQAAIDFVVPRCGLDFKKFHYPKDPYDS